MICEQLYDLANDIMLQNAGRFLRKRDDQVFL